MDRSTIIMHAAALERSCWFVEIALFFSFAAWVPDGFRPIWLPAAFALGAAAFTLAMAGMTRLLILLTDRVWQRARRETIALTVDGVAVRSGVGRGAVDCAWSDVTHVYAFKRDLGTTDMVCLAVVTRDRIVEINERSDGWNDLCVALPERLPGCEAFATWYLDVVREPFALRLRCIYGVTTDDTTGDGRTRVALLVDDDDDNESDEGRAVSTTIADDVRHYLGSGTSGMFLAVAILTAAIGLAFGPRSLATVAALTLLEMAVTRTLLFAALTFGASRSRV